MAWVNHSFREAIAAFWTAAGEEEAFPRSLEVATLLALPIAIVKLPKLSIQKIQTWLLQRGAVVDLKCTDRRIRGCLVIRNGSGIIFIDGTDSADEQRYSLAHEIGHFLAEYWLPRQRAIAKFGLRIDDVFNGVRQPTVTERIGCVLTGVNLKQPVRLLSRSDSFECTNAETWGAEDDADRLALALLAPPEIVLSRVNLRQGRYPERFEKITNVLTGQFGLPKSVASRYGTSLLASMGKGRSWSEHFR